MIEIAPIRLEKNVERLNMPNAFIRSNDQSVVEYESIQERVGVTDGCERQTQEQRTRGSVRFIERVHRLTPPVHESDPWRSEERSPPMYSNRSGQRWLRLRWHWQCKCCRTPQCYTHNLRSNH